MLPQGPVPNDCSITLQLDLSEQLNGLSKTQTPLGDEYRARIQSVSNNGKNVKKQKMSNPQEKNKLKLWSRIRHLLFCVMKLWSTVSPKGKKPLQLIKEDWLVDFLSSKFKTKAITTT